MIDIIRQKMRKPLMGSYSWNTALAKRDTIDSISSISTDKTTFETSITVVNNSMINSVLYLNNKNLIYKTKMKIIFINNSRIYN